MKSKRRREVALKVIKQMKPDKLYIAKELAAEAEISRAKRLTPPEMVGVLQEAKKLGTVEYVRIKCKGYWRKIGESELE